MYIHKRERGREREILLFRQPVLSDFTVSHLRLRSSSTTEVDLKNVVTLSGRKKKKRPLKATYKTNTDEKKKNDKKRNI